MLSPFRVARKISMLLRLLRDVDLTMVHTFANMALAYFSWGHFIVNVMSEIRGRLWL